MDMKDTVRLYCLNDQSREETKIGYMTLKQFKTKTCVRLLPQGEILKLDAIYFDYHELDEAQYKTSYIPTVIKHIKDIIENIWCLKIYQLFSHTADICFNCCIKNTYWRIYHYHN